MIHRIATKDLEFRFRSNRLCLDFLATLGERGHRDIERLASAQDIADWAALAGYPVQNLLVRDVELEAVRMLRAAFVRILEDRKAGRDASPEDVRTVNAAARRPPLRPELTADGRQVDWVADVALAGLMSTLARDFSVFLADSEPERLKTCSDPQCNMFFYDATRANTRIWCATDGKGCGNKAKKRAFRRRQSGAV